MEEAKNTATQESIDVQQRARAGKARIGAIIASIVAVASLAFGGYSQYQQFQLNDGYQQVLESESQLLAEKSGDLLALGDRYGAIQTALSALPESSESGDRPLVPEAQQALQNALEVDQTEGWAPCYAQDDASVLFHAPSSASENGWTAVVSQNQFIEVRELQTGNLVSRIDVADFDETPLSEGSNTESLAFAGDRILYAFEGSIGCFDVQTGELQWKREITDFGRGDGFAASSDGSLVAVTGNIPPDTKTGKRGVRTLHVLKMSDGSTVWDLDVDEIDDQVFTSATVCFSPDGGKIAYAADGGVCEIDTASKHVARCDLGFHYPTLVRYVDGYLVVASALRSSSIAGIGVFDANFHYLWHKTAIVNPMPDTKNREYAYIADVLGSWCLDTGDVPQAPEDTRQLIVALGRDLLFVNPQTGEVAYQIGVDTPLLACKVFPRKTGGHCIAAVTCAGDTLTCSPRAFAQKMESNAHGGRNIGEICEAHLLEHDGTWYLSAWRENPVWHVVYRNVVLADAPEVQSAPELEKLIAQAHELLDAHEAAER